MKIRYVILSYHQMSGVVRTVLTQAAAMAQAGHSVEVVGAVRDFEQPFFPLPERVHYSYLHDIRHRDRDDEPGTLVPLGEPKSAYFTREVEDAVVAYLSSIRGGITVTTRPGLNILNAQFGHRSTIKVAQEHMHLAHHPSDLRDAIVRTYPGLDALVTLTEEDHRDYTGALPDHAPRLTSIPNFLHRGSLRGPRSRLTNQVVVTAGRLTRQKGFDLLIRAFARVVREHPDWELHIYGEGKQEAKLRRLITRRGLESNVQLMGSSDNLDERLAEASLFVLSSRWEGYPMVLIEAMACGLPVVAFDCPRGPREIIREPAEGILVPPEDVRALAAAIDRIIRRPKLRRWLRRNALNRAKDFLPATVTPQWEMLFQQLRRQRRFRAITLVRDHLRHRRPRAKQPLAS